MNRAQKNFGYGQGKIVISVPQNVDLKNQDEIVQTFLIYRICVH